MSVLFLATSLIGGCAPASTGGTSLPPLPPQPIERLTVVPTYPDAEYVLSMTTLGDYWQVLHETGWDDDGRPALSLRNLAEDMRIDVLFLPAHGKTVRAQAVEVRERFGKDASDLAVDETAGTCRDALTFTVVKGDRATLHWFARLPHTTYSNVYLRLEAATPSWVRATGDLRSVVDSLQATRVEPSTPLEQLAQCLTDKGVAMTSVSGCMPCDEQKSDFYEGATRLTVVDCTDEAHDSRPATRECAASRHRGWPTWIFPDGSTLTGRVSLTWIADRAGCPRPPRGEFDL